MDKTAPITKLEPSKSIIEFDDYHGEWLIPIQVAKQNNEPLPLIVCSLIDIPTAPITLREYETIQQRLWFVPLVQRLELVDSVSLAFGKSTQNINIYRVTDLTAYHLLWSRLNTTPVIDFVFSADCNIEKLKRALKIAYQQQSYTPDVKQLKLLASWCYWQQYGGGGDEHFAYYYSNKTNNIKLFEHYLAGDHFKERFQQLTCWTGRIEEASFFLDIKLTYQYQQACYFIFKKDLPSLLDIKTKEQYQQFFKHSAVDDDEDYQQTLDVINTMYYHLKPALSMPAVSEFTHLDVFYKIIKIQDINILKQLLTEGILEDYLLGFFSLDTNPKDLERQILQHHVCMTPESLLKLGEWSIVRRVDVCDNWPCVISASNPEDLSVFIAGDKNYYSYYKINSEPIFLE